MFATDDSFSDGNTLNSAELIDIKRIYSSRLRRCVQTAYEIAVRLKLPIYISSGLSLTAIAVKKRKGEFEFDTLQQIRDFCPGVEIVSCDSYDYEITEEVVVDINKKFNDSSEDKVNNNNSSHHASIISTELLKCKDSKSNKSDIIIPYDNWLTALSTIASYHHLSIIIAHRESIRNLIGYYVNTPYCCMSLFDYVLSEDKKSLSDIPSLGMVFKDNDNEIVDHKFVDCDDDVDDDDDSNDEVSNKNRFICKYLLNSDGTMLNIKKKPPTEC